MLAISHGLSNKQIGARLHISEMTVKTYVSRMLEISGATCRAELVRKGFEAGILTNDPPPEWITTR